MGSFYVNNGNFVAWTKTQTTLVCCCVSVLMLLQYCCVNVIYVGILCTICDCCDRTLRTRTGKVWVKRNRWSGSTVFCNENWSSWMQGPTACVRNAALASVRPAQPPQPPLSAPPLAHHPLVLPRSLVGSVLWAFSFTGPLRILKVLCSLESTGPSHTPNLAFGHFSSKLCCNWLHH